MKFLAGFLLLVLCSCGSTRLTADGGMSSLNSDQAPVDEHTVVGFEISQAPETGGLGWELGGRYGEDSGVQNGLVTNSESNEFYGGARYEAIFDWFQPYLSGGITNVRIRTARQESPTADDSDIGYYLNLGTDFAIGQTWFLGLAVRRTFDIRGQFNGLQGDADAWQYLVRLGVRF